MYFDDKKPGRRAMLLAGAAAGTTAALGAASVLSAGQASAATTAPGTSWLPYPADVTDTSHCTEEAAAIFRGFFTAKSEHNAAALMSYFAKPNGRYLASIFHAAEASA